MTTHTTDRNLPVPDHSLAGALARAAMFRAYRYGEVREYLPDDAPVQDQAEALFLDMNSDLPDSIVVVSVVSRPSSPETGHPYTLAYLTCYGPGADPAHIVITTRLEAQNLPGEHTEATDENPKGWDEDNRFSAVVHTSREAALAHMCGVFTGVDDPYSPRDNGLPELGDNLPETYLEDVLATIIHSTWSCSLPVRPYRFVDWDGTPYPDLTGNQAEVN